MPLTDILTLTLLLGAFVFFVGSVWRGITGEIEYRRFYADRPTSSNYPLDT